MIDMTMLLLALAGVIAIGFALMLVIVYNSFIQMQNNIDKSWANIDVLLKQRSNEIPNLIEIVKGYMSHEKKTFESLTKARSLMINADSLSQKAAADNKISGLVKSLFAVAEDYPDLKAIENFLSLQKRITGLENELADRREFFNDSVTIYNTRIQSIPDVFIARLLHLSKKDLFEASEKDKKYVEIHL